MRRSLAIDRGINMFRKVFLAVFVFNVLFISLPSLSLAEAWVLWSRIDSDTVSESDKTTVRSDLKWTIIYGYPAYDTCLKAQATLYKNRLNFYKQTHPGERISEVENSKILVAGQTAVLAETFYCLPATIDPREPKK